MFVSLSIYENILTSAVTGEMVCLETGSNQFLADNKIEGNEEFSFKIETRDGELFRFQGFVNKISNRTMSPNAQNTYVVEFVSPFVRNNEQTRLMKRYKNENPKDIISDCLDEVNEDGDGESKLFRNVGEGFGLQFVASNWTPLRTIQYTQKHGVPHYKGGTTGISADGKNSTVKRAEGTGGFLFYETLRGHCFGSVSQMLRGELGEKLPTTFKYELAESGASEERKRHRILSYNNIQNNDVQTSQRAGAFKAKQIVFNMDTGVYQEQEWESPMATEKQKQTSKKHTRVMMSTLTNDRWQNECRATPENQDDQCALSALQGNGSFSNMGDGVCQMTLNIRTDIHVGDTMKVELNEVSADTFAKDLKHSGDWIISGIGHHFSLEHMGAYSRVTAIRPSDYQQIRRPESMR